MNLQFRCIKCGTIVGCDGIRTDGVRCPICKSAVTPEPYNPDDIRVMPSNKKSSVDKPSLTILPDGTPRVSIKAGVSGTPLIESETKTLLTVDIKTSDLPEVKEFIEKANDKISKQQKLIESFARIVDGMIEDVEDVRDRLIEVLACVETANTTTRLEEHDEALRKTIKSLGYLINFLSDIDKEV